MASLGATELNWNYFRRSRTVHCAARLVFNLSHYESKLYLANPQCWSKFTCYQFERACNAVTLCSLMQCPQLPVLMCISDAVQSRRRQRMKIYVRLNRQTTFFRGCIPSSQSKVQARSQRGGGRKVCTKIFGSTFLLKCWACAAWECCCNTVYFRSAGASVLSSLMTMTVDL